MTDRVSVSVLEHLTPHGGLQLVPGWWQLVQEPFASDSADAIEEWLATVEAPPPLLRALDESFHLDALYPGSRKQDPRMRLFGTMVIKTKKQATCALSDPNAAGLVALELRSKAALEVLLGMKSFPFGPLRRVKLDFSPSHEQLEAMAVHPLLQQLESFCVYNTLADRLALVARMPWLPQLRSLELSFALDKVPVDCAIALAEVPFERLRGFDGTTKDWEPNEKAFRALGEAPWLREVQHLHLSFPTKSTRLSDRFASSFPVEGLRSWTINGWWKPETLRALLRRLGSLRYLASSNSLQIGDAPEGSRSFGAAEAEALVASGCVPRLRDVPRLDDAASEIVTAAGWPAASEPLLETKHWRVRG